MSFQHKELAAGRWQQLTFLEQMAHIGSEVGRALNWRAKNNDVYSQKAAGRALELIDITLEAMRDFGRLKELARLREVLADYFFGKNEYLSTEAALKNYFLVFNYAARKHL